MKAKLNLYICIYPISYIQYGNIASMGWGGAGGGGGIPYGHISILGIGYWIAIYIEVSETHLLVNTKTGG